MQKTTNKKPAVISASAPVFVPKSVLVKEVTCVKDSVDTQQNSDLALVSQESKSQDTIVLKSSGQEELKTIDPVVIGDGDEPLVNSTSLSELTSKQNLQNEAAKTDNKDAIDISNENVAKQVEIDNPVNLECDTKQFANHELSKNKVADVQEDEVTKTTVLV